MMKSRFSLCILLLVMLSSCKKTSNVEVSLSTSGKLSYKLLDDKGNGIANVKVTLYDNINSSYETPILLDTKVTNDSGLADFGDLNPNTYKVVPDSPMVNNVKYVINDYVQVLTGKNNVREVRVTDYVGTFRCIVRNYSTLLGVKNIGILVIPRDQLRMNVNADVLSKYAEFKGVTNDQGIVSFIAPSDKSYGLVTYNINSKEIENIIYSMNVGKDKIEDVGLYTPSN